MIWKLAECFSCKLLVFRALNSANGVSTEGNCLICLSAVNVPFAQRASIQCRVVASILNKTHCWQAILLNPSMQKAHDFSGLDPVVVEVSQHFFKLVSIFQQFPSANLYVDPPKQLEKNYPKDGKAGAPAAAPTTFSGFGGAKSSGVWIWKYFMSGCMRYPQLLTSPPLNGCPGTNSG